MNLNTVALVVLILAAIPCGLFLLNLTVYRPLAKPKTKIKTPVSVLIPARNEQSNIRATLEAALASHECNFEIIVLDDHSTDRTAAIAGEFARHEHRVRLESAPLLPFGWCGKQHACFVLAKLARHPLLVFIDADVRLAPDALARMAAFMQTSRAALASGVPHQELGTFGEYLLIPLIHFILLGFLPMHAMRRTGLPAFSAGCGQLFIARRDAYGKTGGHAMIRNTLHDGVKLPRLFRRCGFHTELFDATDIAACRMYHSTLETWRGLGKNATEGLARPGTILPMTALLFGGQVLPFVLLAFAPMLSSSGLMLAGCAGVLALIPRLIATFKFRQPFCAALLHPLGVLSLLALQWHALRCHLAGKPSFWKGRTYSSASAVEPKPLEKAPMLTLP
jgi:hypothetical protein